MIIDEEKTRLLNEYEDLNEAKLTFSCEFISDTLSNVINPNHTMYWGNTHELSDHPDTSERLTSFLQTINDPNVSPKDRLTNLANIVHQEEECDRKRIFLNFLFATCWFTKGLRKD